MIYTKKQGFTALELLMVIAVISILSALLLSGVTSARKKARQTKTKTLIETITVALGSYRNDYIVYPPADIPSVTGESSSECLYYFLGSTFVGGVNSSINSGPYVELRSQFKSTWTGRRADMNGDGDTSDTTDKLYRIVDSWDTPLIYTNPGIYNIHSIDIYSFGPDSTDDSGSGDDINNWD